MPQTDVIIKKILEESKTIALFGHYHPDGDCVGSLLGLGKALENLGKKVEYFTPSPPSKVFSFLPSFPKIQTDFSYKKYDAIVFVDLSSYSRIGKFREENNKYFTQQKVIIFDHHPEEGPANALMIKDINASSSAELLFEYIQKRWKKAIDQEVATSFYLGLVTDSGNFMFDQNHERIFTNALELIKYWADKTTVVDNFFRRTSLDQVRFVNLLLKRLTTYKDILYSYYDEKELEKYNIDDEQAGYGISIIQNIQGPRLCILAKKKWKKIRLSLRSKNIGKGTVDCTEIAHHFEGGGHKYASGGSMQAQGTLKQDLQKAIKKIQKMID